MPGAPDDPALRERLRAEAGLDEAAATRVIELVREALLAQLDADTRTRVLARLAAKDEPTPEAVEDESTAPLGRTLADGRPGHAHPLAEAGPDRGQSGSVAQPGAHEDSKLSTSHGISSERYGESLADGAPGSRNPLSRGKPR